MKPIILFESYPDFTGNSLAIYEKLMSLGYDNKYELLWAVDNSFNKNTQYKTVKFFNTSVNNIINILEQTKLIIDSNRYINKYKNVFRMHVRHGVCFKNVPLYTNAIGKVDALITTSAFMKNVDKKVYKNIDDSKIIITGFPANDKLFSPKNLYDNGVISELTKTNNKFNKIIGWFPTYRQHNNCTSLRTKFTFDFGLPLIKSDKDYVLLDKKLKETNTLLIIQMHQNQLKNYKTIQNTQNLVFITPEIKEKYNIINSDLLGNFDSLITDYSAAYHEYIILNRPIGLTIDDLVEYSHSVGFSYNYLDVIKGNYMLDILDLLNFIEEISNNNDSEKIQRQKSLDKIHTYQDNKSTDRVINYLITNKLI